MSSSLGIVLFGVGRAGSIHLRNLLTLPRARLLFVVDADVSTARDRLRAAGCDVEVLDSGDSELVNAKVFSNPEVGAVVVCSPTYAHEDTVTAALRNGKAVFCEKPLSMTFAGTQACFQLSRETGVPLFVAFQRRFDPTFAEVKRRVQAGDLGHVEVIKSTSRDNPVPSLAYLKISGGMYHDCIIHDVDMILWQLQDEPVEVFAQAHAFREEVRSIGDVDTVVVTIKFASGTLATVDVSRVAVYGYDQRLEVFGAKGMAEAGLRRAHAVLFSDHTGAHMPPAFYSFDSRYVEAYRAEMLHFVDAVLDAKPLLVTEEQCLLALRVVDAAAHSAKTGQRVLMAEFASP